MIACVYDGSIRDNGTPRLFREAFTEVLNRRVPWFSQASPIPEGHPFYFHIDDGRDDLVAVPPRPWGFYCTDSHLGPGPRLEKARQADIVWCAQKDFAESLQAEGINARWLPLACSPKHHPTAVEVAEREDQPLAEKVYDIAFVGHLQPPDKTSRIAFLDALRVAFPNFRYEFGVFHRDMAKVYHRSRIGVNHAVRNDLNMRLFELASAGVVQLADQRMMGLRELGFEAWGHYIPYGGPWSEQDVAADAVGAIKWALRYPGRFTEMAERAKALVRGQHTYAHRVRTMLADASALVGKNLCETNEAASSVTVSTTPTTSTPRSALGAAPA